MMNAIVGAWVNAVGGYDVIGALFATAFIFVVGAIFYKILSL